MEAQTRSKQRARRADPRAARPRDRPPALVGDRRLDRADAVRRVRRRPALEALVPELLDPRQARLRGEPADAEGLRRRRAAAERRRLPHRSGDVTKSAAIAAAIARAAHTMPGSLTSSYFDTHDLDVRLEATATRPSRTSTRRARRSSTRTSGAKQMRAAAAPGLPAGIKRAGDRPRPARGGEHARRRRQLERPARGGDRRPRRARDPALRLRDAAGGADADPRRGRARSSTRSRSSGS